MSIDAELIDEIGRLDAEIARLRAELAAAREKLEALREPTYVGGPCVVLSSEHPPPASLVPGAIGLGADAIERLVRGEMISLRHDRWLVPLEPPDLVDMRATARRKALEEVRDMACLWCKNGWALVEDCSDLHQHPNGGRYQPCGAPKIRALLKEPQS